MIVFGKHRYSFYLSKVALLILTLLLYFLCAAQSKTDKIPLHRFFQEHFDSTIIYQQRALWQPADYFIVAKKDTQVFTFRYAVPYPEIGDMKYPSALAHKLIMENVYFEKILPDTNLYFKPFEVTLESRSEDWKSINAFAIWNLESSMRDTLVNCQIYDGAYDTYFLITKEKIKVLEYYEAEFFEEWEGTNNNRRNEIQTRGAILQFFKYNSR